MADKLYKLVIVKVGPKTKELEMENAPSYKSKGACEVALEHRLNTIRTHASLVPGGIRFGGACIEIEEG